MIKYFLQGLNKSWDKHASLFSQSVNDEEKSFGTLMKYSGANQSLGQTL